MPVSTVTIKSKDEIALMREAGRLNAEVRAALREAVAPGVTGRDLDGLAKDEIAKRGGQPTFVGYGPGGRPPYPGAICYSVNDHLVHGIPGSRALKEGDIVSIDDDGFITIRGRAKRFAKIAGEMVSLAAVEMMTADLWPENAPALVSIPDARKGERLIMATTKQGATRAEVQAHMKARGATELMMPAEIMIVDALPLLGSGKTDYVELDKMVRAKFLAQSGVAA